MKRRSLLSYGCLLLASCSVTQQRSGINSSTGSVTLPTTLTLAVTDAKGQEELAADYELFRQALATALDTHVNFFPVSGHLAAAPAMLTGEVDLVWSGPSEYLVLAARAQAVPLIALNRPNFHSVLVVRADRNLQSLADLRGKTVDLRKVGSTTSHIGGAKMLLAAGLTPDVDVNVVMSGQRTLQGLKEGEVDAVVMAVHRYQTLLDAENLTAADYPILKAGEPLPGDIFVASRQLDTAIIETMRTRMQNHQEQLLQSILTSPSLAKKFKNSSLDQVDIKIYEALRETYQAIGQEDLIQ